MKKFQSLMAAALIAALGIFTSCSDDDNKDDHNAVIIEKNHDTAILLCTFGSTFELPQSTYDAIVKDYKAQYPNADIYLSFTSRTCVSRVGASIGKYFAQPDLWLKAIGNAGYTTVGVQSLHVIPGEEYLSLMNTDVKKNFMTVFPNIKVAKGACLLEGNGTEEKGDDISAVAEVLYNEFCKDKVEKGEYVVFTGHGNPESEYNHANSRYSELEEALQALDKSGKKHIFVGTVDYGNMMFSYIRKELADATGHQEANTPSNGAKQMTANNIVIHLAPVMSVAGDHAHNDMAGNLEDGQTMDKVNPYESDHEAEYSWKLKLQKLGYSVTEDNCHMVGLGDYAKLRQIWSSHLDMSTAESWNEHLGIEE